MIDAPPTQNPAPYWENGPVFRRFKEEMEALQVTGTAHCPHEGFWDAQSDTGVTSTVTLVVWGGLIPARTEITFPLPQNSSQVTGDYIQLPDGKWVYRCRFDVAINLVMPITEVTCGVNFSGTHLGDAVLVSTPYVGMAGD